MITTEVYKSSPSTSSLTTTTTTQNSANKTATTPISKTPSSSKLLQISSSSQCLLNGKNGKVHFTISPSAYESLIDKINKRISNNERWYSLEFFPPKTSQGASNLIAK